MRHPFKICIVVFFLIFFVNKAYTTPYMNKWLNPMENQPQELKQSRAITGQACRDALLKAPENASLHACVAVDEMNKEHWNDAVMHWKDAINLSKEKPETDYYIGLAWTYAKMQELPAATETIRKALQFDPQSISLHYWQAVLWEWKGESDKVEKEYRKMISLSPKDDRPMELFYHAVSLLQVGEDDRLSDAAKDLNAFLKAKPDDYKGMILLGQTYIKMKDPDKALSTLEAAEAINPDFSALQLLLTQANLMMERPEPAIAHGKKVLHADPDNLTAHFLVGTAYLKTGRTEQGIEHLNRIEEGSGAFGNARLLVGEAYFSEGKIEQARTTLQELVDHNPKDPTARVSLIRLLIAGGEQEEAVKQCNFILRAAPDNIPVQFMKGVALFEGDKAKEAETVFKKIVARQEPFYPAHMQLIQIYASQGKIEQALGEVDSLIKKWPNHPVGYIMKGDMSYVLGRKDNAIEAYNQAVKIDPDSTYTWTKILHLQIEQKEFSKAETLADQLIQNKPSFPESYLVKGITAMHNERIEAAKSYFNRVLELNDDHYGAHNYLGLINLELSKEEAIAHYEKSLGINPRQPVVYLQLTKLYVKTNNKNKGFRTAERWAKAYPDQGAPYELMAMISIEENKNDEAMGYLKKAISLEPMNPSFYLSLGSLYEKLGEQNDAIVLYEAALKNIPDHPVLLNNLAWHYSETGRLDDALTLSTKAEQKAPDDWNIKDTIGQIYFQKGDYRKAIKKYDEAIAVNDQNPMLYFHIGKAYIAIGENQKALHFLKKTESYPFNSSKKEEIEKLITSLNLQ